MKHPQFSSAYVMIISWTKHDLFSWNIFFLLDLRLYRKMCDSIEVSRVKILDALVIGKFNEAVEVTNLPLCPLKYNHLSISRFTTISFRWPIWSERSRSTFFVIGWEGRCLSFIEWISKSFFYQLLYHCVNICLSLDALADSERAINLQRTNMHAYINKR